MNILVDAYNLLKWLVGSSVVLESQRRQFIAILKRYALQKKHTVWLVFDGGSFPSPRKERASDWMYIVYAGFESSADAYITHFMAEHRQRPLVVASSDAYVRKMARSYQATSLTSADFWELVRGEISEQTTAFARSGTAHRIAEETSSSEVDAMMENALVFDKEVDVATRERKSNSRSFSKNEKKRARIIKKL